MKILIILLLTITTFNSYADLRRQEGADLPSGMVLTFAGIACPSGTLIADGSAVSRTSYSKLFVAIGSAHGSGDGSTTFNLPDYRGLFLRMVDGAKGNDSDKLTRTAMNTGGNVGNLIGSVQTDAMQGHKHELNRLLGMRAGVDGSYDYFSQSANANDLSLYSLASEMQVAPVTDGVNGTPRTSSETRVKNAYVTYCIKI